jgi:ADP-heptose:LPS heptosyltransferase
VNVSFRNVNKICVFRALQLGDLLCAIPAVRGIRRNFPTAEIHLIGLPWSVELVGRFSNYFDGHIPFPGHPGLPEQHARLEDLPKFLQQVQDQHYDLVLQMHGSGGIVNPLVACFNARITAGFHEPDRYRPSPYFIPYPGFKHEIHRHLDLINALGMDTDNDELEFPLFEEDFTALTDAGIDFPPQTYVCVHPGARDKARQWPVDKFARIADICAAFGYEVVITGSEHELPLAEKMRSGMRNDALIATGKTSLGALGVLVKNAKAVVSNCTGIVHLAAALKTRSVVVSLDKEPWRWAPLDKNTSTTIEWLKQPDYRLVEKAVAGIVEGNV